MFVTYDIINCKRLERIFINKNYIHIQKEENISQIRE